MEATSPSPAESAQLTHHELSSALRQAGCACVEDVHLAVIENNGAISVVPRPKDD